MNYNQYTMEQHTIVGMSYGALTGAFVGTNWVDMRFIDEATFIFMKELGTAGRDPQIRFQARPKGGLTATFKTVKPHYLVKKTADTIAAIKGTGFTNALPDLSKAAASLHQWTDLTTAEDALVLVGGIFPEDLVRAGAGLHEVRMQIKGSSADAAQFYMATMLARLKDPEPMFGSIAIQRVK